MPTLILWRPLTFWDEEQINFIKENENRAQLTKNSEYLSLKKDYTDKQIEKDKLEEEIDDLYNQLADICVGMWINRNDARKYI